MSNCRQGLSDFASTRAPSCLLDPADTTYKSTGQEPPVNVTSSLGGSMREASLRLTTSMYSVAPLSASANCVAEFSVESSPCVLRLGCSLDFHGCRC